MGILRAFWYCGHVRNFGIRDGMGKALRLLLMLLLLIVFDTQIGQGEYT